MVEPPRRAHPGTLGTDTASCRPTDGPALSGLSPRLAPVSDPSVPPQVLSVSDPLVPPWVLLVSAPSVPPRVLSVSGQPLSAIAGHRTPRLFLPQAPVLMSRPTLLPPGRSVCRGCFYIGTQRFRRFPILTRVLRMLPRLRRPRRASVVSFPPPVGSLCYCLRRGIADPGTAVFLL